MKRINIFSSQGENPRRSSHTEWAPIKVRLLTQHLVPEDSLTASSQKVIEVRGHQAKGALASLSNFYHGKLFAVQGGWRRSSTSREKTCTVTLQRKPLHSSAKPSHSESRRRREAVEMLVLLLQPNFASVHSDQVNKSEPCKYEMHQ